MEEVLHSWQHDGELLGTLFSDTSPVRDKIADEIVNTAPKVPIEDKQPDVVYPLPVSKLGFRFVDANGNELQFPVKLLQEVEYRHDMLDQVRDSGELPSDLTRSDQEADV